MEIKDFLEQVYREIHEHSYTLPDNMTVEQARAIGEGIALRHGATKELMQEVEQKVLRELGKGE